MLFPHIYTSLYVVECSVNVRMRTTLPPGRYRSHPGLSTTPSNFGCLLLCQRFRKFRSEFKWKGPFRFLPTGIFGIISGGGSLISVGIFRSKFAVPGCFPLCQTDRSEISGTTQGKWNDIFLLNRANQLGIALATSYHFRIP